MIKVNIQTNKILQDCLFELDLYYYFLCLELLYNGIPMKIDPLNIKNHPIGVIYGTLNFIQTDINNLIIEFKE